MCQAVCFTSKGRVCIEHFHQKNAHLPLLLKDGTMLQVKWGRRHGETGELPLGGWADLADIRAGHWDQFFPKPVKILASKFLEINFEGRSEWFDVTPGHWIQGLFIAHKTEPRVYVVTLKPKNLQVEFWRWPRLLNSQELES